MEIDLIIENINTKLEKSDFEKVDKYDLQKGAPDYEKYVSVVKSIIYKNQKNMLTYRFLIEYDLEDGEENKTALFIMKNPSKADKKKSDRTVNMILETAHYLKYSKVYIMNLFPEYSSKPYNIHVEGLKKEVLKKHDELIESISNKVTCIFVAWGTNAYYQNNIKKFYNGRILSVKEKLQNEERDVKILCQHYNKDNEPTHPSARLSEYKWIIKKEENDYLPWPKEETKI